MSFTVTTKDAPSSSTPSTDKPMSARDRAIAAFNKGPTAAQANTAPVANPTNVQPEELSAIKPRETIQEPSTSDNPSQTQTNTSEAPVTSSAATQQEPQQNLSAQYAQLARKEKALRAQVNELNAQKAEIAKREEAIKAKDAEYQSKFISKDRLKEDLVNQLLDAGLTYDEVTQAFLNQPNPQETALGAEIRALKAEILALKEESKGTKQSIQDQQTQSYQQAVGQIRNEAKRLVANDPAFETIKATKSVEEVVTLITKTFEEDGYLMTVEEAAQAVENELVDEVSKYAQLSKIQKKLQANQPAAAKQSPQPANPKNSNSATAQQPSAKTLTNSMSTTRPMTTRERAIAAFNGTLNKG